jgi:outer membrane protein insertion porin family
MKLKKLAVLIPLLYATSAIAIEPFVVKDIRVEGIQRTEAGTVFSYLPVKVGDTLDDEHATAAIRALFATGFFKDVSLEVEQGVLIVLVRERPAIGSVEINGVKDFPKDQLSESLKNIGLAEGRIFDRSSLDKAVQELKRQYVARGKYAVTVNAKVTDLERNRVAISFDVVEGEASKIKQINIIGAHAYSESDLRDMMKLDTPNWASWFSKSDQYSKQKLSADLEIIRSYYLDQGYLEFSLDSTQVSITPDKQDIFITINLTEGNKYTVSDIKYAGPESILQHDEMRKLSTVKPGDTFSRKELTASTSKIGDRLGDFGYAFANVNAVPELDKEKHQVVFTFMVDPGHRVYVRHINISGNTKTRDEVIRREFRQIEGGWFASSKIKKSKQRVDRLDYFSEVNVETPAVPGSNDQLDVNLSVKEKSTGDFSIGAGLSSGEGLVLTTAITERNLFGTGNILSTQVNTSKVNTIYSVSYTNPYYTDEGMSRGFDIFERNMNAARTAMSQYTSSTLGGGVRYGLPLNDDDALHYGLRAEQTKLGLTALSPQRYVQYVNIIGSDITDIPATIGWGRDTRDSAINTTSGTVLNVSTEIGLPISDNLRYYKLNYQHQWFRPVTHDVTLMLKGDAGVGNGYGGNPMPINQYLYAGGPGSVRGFSPMSIGPRDINDNALGGTKRVVGNAELLFPMPGMSKEQSVRLSLFADTGAVYGPSDMPDTGGFRSSVGAALTWISPVGPLKISFARPLNVLPSDKVQKFQFTLGNLF